MDKRIFFICLAALACLTSFAQEIDTLYFAGYKIVIVPAEEFRIDIKHPELGKKRIKGNTLRLELIDARGSMPKDTVIVYANKIRHIAMDYSQLVMEQPFKVDSLSIFTGSSHGTINVEANYLEINAGAASHLMVKGKVKNMKSDTTGIGNYIDKSSLIVEQTDKNTK